MKKLNCILLIDDDEVNNLLNVELFQTLELCNEVQVFEDASEALIFLNSSFPELIFVDLEMPLMEGRDFLREFLQLQIIRDRNSKVVILSAYISQKTRPELDIFGIPYVEKPLTSEKVLSILETLEITVEP